MRPIIDESVASTAAASASPGWAANFAMAAPSGPGVSAADSRDILWVHNSVELWDLLVNDRGWPADRYGRWIGEQLIAALL